MSVFIDTSAFLAVLDADDQNHQSAASLWQGLLNEKKFLRTSNYVVVETVALLQNRLGMSAVQAFHTEIMPVAKVIWIDIHLHQAGVSAVLASNRRRLSLVDCTSFAAMEKYGIQQVFAFDKHFVERGFLVLP